ncbi:COX15/CtaA family protein [Prosthecomicrobium sp. N25]|uniref:COX15/CtaA family protein n=1 Tax=Prosthecomicrobium sp. N25 TaxID=3129254 RepID=UPI00307710D2
MTMPTSVLTSSAAERGNPRAAVRLWLGFVAFLVFAMVIVGGATRLTDSGLSITEWQPILGAIPPLTEADWQAAFEKYKAIPEYALVNRDMTLAGFKVIYWWEWAHRFLGRFIGVAFLAPFLWFLARGAIRTADAPRFVALFLLGGLQGAVGWWMVSSGLVDRVDVAPYRLATHLTLACLIFAGLVWTAASLEPATLRRPESGRVRTGATVLVAAVFLQIFLGGLVAGNDAGLVYNTWPLMEGGFAPSGLWTLEPAWRNLFENHGLVQLMHRMGAYLLLAVALVQAWNAAKGSWTRAVRTSAFWVAGLVVLQAAVGVATLLLVVPLHVALLHQGLAVIVLMAAVLHLRAVRHPS